MQKSIRVHIHKLQICPRKEGVYTLIGYTNYKIVQYDVIQLLHHQSPVWATRYEISLQVHRSQGGELETTVEISGEPEAREKAKEMIEEIITPIKDITDKLSGTV